MIDHQSAIVAYRLKRAHEAWDEAKLLWNAGHFNTYVNRLYYACYYAVSALLIKNGFSSSTHAGAQNLFAQHFVKVGIVSKKLGEFYYTLFHYRQESDYKDNYRIDEELAAPWLEKARDFVSLIEELANRAEP